MTEAVHYKKRKIRIKVNKRIFLITKSFISICVFYEVSVVWLQKIGILCHNQYFPNLGNPIAYQKLFYKGHCCGFVEYAKLFM